MSIFFQLSVLAIRPVIGIAADGLGLGIGKEGLDEVAARLREHLTNHGAKVAEALKKANKRAWVTLEMALGGDSFFSRLGNTLHSADQRALANEVRDFLDQSAPALEKGNGPQYRKQCLAELRAARKAELLSGDAADLRDLGNAAARLAKLTRPEQQLAVDLEGLQTIAAALPASGFTNLKEILSLRASVQHAPLLAEAARFFFRREVETDEALFRGLTFSHAQAQSSGLESLAKALDQCQVEIQSTLDSMAQRVEEIYTTVLDMQEAMRQAKADNAGSYELLKEISLHLVHLDMSHGTLAPRNSLSIRSDGERQAVKMLLQRYRQLSPEEQSHFPAGLNGLGKLLVGAGAFEEAGSVFKQGAAQIPSDPAAAELHFNAYRAALEQRNWADALASLRQATACDAARFAPFPTDKYRIDRILGAGGFGVAFLCHDQYMDERVVIKSLYADDLERDVKDLFAEARVLRRLDHPNIVNVTDCDFAGTGRLRPYFVMDYFEGQTLQSLLENKGAIDVPTLLSIVIPVAEALQAAHNCNVLHRDLKPDNLLVNNVSGSWQIRLIDFGLALRPQTVRDSMSGSSLSQSVLGSGVAGTLEYAPPEQLGRISQPCGPYSDIYSFAKVCSRALFGTTEPRRRHMDSIPRSLADLLDSAMELNPKDRPKGFEAVLQVLRSCGTPEPAAMRKSSPSPVPPSADADEMYRRGLKYESGEGVAKDEAEAVKCYLTAAEGGNAKAMVKMGFALSTGRGVPQDDKQAAEWYRKAAYAGNSDGMFNLGNTYKNSTGDDKQAVEWYRKAADAGHSGGMVNLGIMYGKGRGVPWDDKQAAEWFRKGADAGNSVGMSILGGMYARGQGVPQDHKQAVEWYRKAANAGHSFAMFNLGVMYDQGRGVKKDDKQAAEWFRKAADAGDSDGMFNLGVMYSEGRGVSKDDKQAVEWYRKAAAAGSKNAIAELKRRGVQLSR